MHFCLLLCNMVLYSVFIYARVVFTLDLVFDTTPKLVTFNCTWGKCEYVCAPSHLPLTSDTQSLCLEEKTIIRLWYFVFHKHVENNAFIY